MKLISAVIRLFWMPITLVAGQLFSGAAVTTGPSARSLLTQAVLADGVVEKERLLKELVGYEDEIVEQVLGAWRGGAVFLYETNQSRIPFLLDTQSDTNGNAKGIRIEDGRFIELTAGSPAWFTPSELTPADADSSLRKAIKTTLDLYSLGHANPKLKLAAIVKLGQEQNANYLPHFQKRLQIETTPESRRALLEAIALTRTIDSDMKTRVAAIMDLGALRSLNSISLLRTMDDSARKDPGRFDPETTRALHHTRLTIENYMWWGNLWGTLFRGLSLSAVLLVAALGLAITFGLMGIINMAHGEFMMIGAYTTYVTQGCFDKWFGGTALGLNTYFPVAIVASFVVAALAGLLMERGIIQFLYRRPLESLLATWGVSLLLQQVFRHTFGAANVQVSSPSWLSGSWVLSDVPLAYNRLFVVLFAASTVLGVYLLLTRTSLGLLIRAVMQNRAMASCLGVKTSHVNMMTFALGSGLAGTAGACLSQIGNVGPSLGQSYIVDCFMVVVLGGIGNTLGTVSASLGVGVTDQILQPWLGAVMGKITVLAAIILFLQWRPAGLFATRSRSLD
ncbi:MAG: urea ABC transporter permease subunit UrtB [Verrucomicrobia bacterium]|nr:urea ABC transporter permease subunit UrtB [Verrucomicrobiota bacterium]